MQLRPWGVELVLQQRRSMGAQWAEPVIDLFLLIILFATTKENVFQYAKRAIGFHKMSSF